MYENRTFDIEEFSIKHINRIENSLIEEYECEIDGINYLLLIGITKSQKAFLKQILDRYLDDLFILYDKEYILFGCSYRYTIVECRNVIEFRKQIEDKKTQLESTIEIVNKNIPDLISPNGYLDFAYNRMDLNYDSYKVLCITRDEDIVYVPYSIKNEKVILGIGATPLDSGMLKDLLDWVPKNECRIKEIEITFSMAYDNRLAARNNFIVLFPDTYEELLKRVKKKTIGNVRREKTYFENEVDDITFRHYSRKNIDKGLVNTYFRMKKETHQCDYNLEWDEYLEKYYVTDAYTIEQDGHIYSILFSCEQGQIAYLENFSYENKYKKYSLGTILYWHYLAELIKNEKKSLYLAGGSYQYKKHFANMNLLCFSGVINCIR